MSTVHSPVVLFAESRKRSGMGREIKRSANNGKLSEQTLEGGSLGGMKDRTLSVSAIVNKACYSHCM